MTKSPATRHIFALIVSSFAVSAACKMEDEDPEPAPPGGTDGSITFVSSPGDGGNEGTGLTGADTTGGGLCVPDMAQFDCKFVAAVTYCRNDDSSICSTFPPSVGEPPVLGCVLPDATTMGDHVGIIFPGTCGVWAGHAYDYTDLSDPLVSEIYSDCEVDCNSYLAGGFGPLVVDDGTHLWNATNTRCYTANNADDWDEGLSGGYTLAQAYTECGLDLETGFPPPQVQEADDAVVACGSDNCASVDCSDYNSGTLAASSVTNTSQRRVYANIPATNANILLESPTTMFCSNGRYTWSSTATRSRFTSLGAGDLYYKMGLRNGDRILTMRNFTPGTWVQTGTTYSINTPVDLLNAYEALVASGGVHVAMTVRRGTANWTVFVTST